MKHLLLLALIQASLFAQVLNGSSSLSGSVVLGSAAVSSGGGGGGNTVTYDSAFEKGSSATSSPFSFVSNAGTVSGSVGTGSNRVLIAYLGSPSDLGTPSVTWGGTSMTSITNITTPSGKRLYVFGLKNPSSGAQTISATFTGGSAVIVLGASSFSGVNQTTSWQNVSSDTGTGTSASSAVTSSNGNMAVAVHLNDDATSTSINAGTSDWIETSFTGNYAMAHRASTGSSTAISWTLGASVGWANAKVDIIAN